MTAVTSGTTTHRAPRGAKAWYKILYVQVLIAIVLGVIVGWLWPHLATNDWIKALGDGFIKLIKMVIAPIIFCTVVSGISHIQDARKVGRVGVKALVYFEIVSSFALIIGLIMGNLFQAGHGLAATPDAAAVATYVKQAEAQKSVDFVLNIIPDSVVGALARGDILQVLLFAILFGFALMALGERGHRLRDVIDDTSHAVFGVIAIVMKAAPLGAFGAMAYTIGKFGPAALGNLLGLIALFYITAALFVVIVLGLIARMVGFNIFKFIGLHQGRAADRARHQFVGKRAAAIDGEARAARLFQAGGRARGADRLFVQPRRHQHLHDAGDAVHRAGARRRSHL